VAVKEEKSTPIRSEFQFSVSLSFYSVSFDFTTGALHEDDLVDASLKPRLQPEVAHVKAFEPAAGGQFTTRLGTLMLNRTQDDGPSSTDHGRGLYSLLEFLPQKRDHTRGKIAKESVHGLDIHSHTIRMEVIAIFFGPCKYPINIKMNKNYTRLKEKAST
jgi:hypothetical protein